MVKYRWPLKSVGLTSHCTLVSSFRWASDESFACSVGGRDRCTFQFKIVRDQPPAPQKAYSFQPLDREGVVWSDPTAAPPPAGGGGQAASKSPSKPGAFGYPGRPASARR